ncbi:MAG TPA: VOC family protein [Alphaproteobacteria bacterium]|jgi:catechol 2,3-dioxygenase-like lactoylglutathione lyase family enzyme|nr:VOC family protein [Alphaproteobacteria bacterium]
MSGLHHTHLFASDLAASVAWYRTMLGGEVAFDGEFGGARNVFMRLGSGRLHLYDQPPRGETPGAVHHLGYQSDDLAGLVAHMRGQGAVFRSDIREFGFWRYVMCAAPDDVLWELFEFDEAGLPPDLANYFAGG